LSLSLHEQQNELNKRVSVTGTNHLKTDIDPTPKTCVRYASDSGQWLT